ncbi:hypothetical protein [Flexithrix dorotheae]|uniref:hypothetical protein n=1 Tax=Flexithrix dorotheae TaxID=70993 RepID=UPI00036AF7E0|nr:hypothetical protein [Flexithrix dorotheae]
MIYRIGLVISIIFLSFQSFAQRGKVFPQITGETLSDKSMTLPSDTRGKYTLVGMAYSKKSDNLLKQWFSPLHQTFIDPPKNDLFPDDDGYDVNMYFVALLKGIYKTANGTITKKMKAGIQPKFHDNTMIYQGSIKEYKKQLKLGEKDLPYFFVLDKNGNIVYHTSGAYSDKKLYEIMSAVTD